MARDVAIANAEKELKAAEKSLAEAKSKGVELDKAREEYMFAQMKLKSLRELHNLEEDQKQETAFRRNLRPHLEPIISAMKAKIGKILAPATLTNIFIIPKKLPRTPNPEGEFRWDSIEVIESNTAGKPQSKSIDERKKETLEEAVDRLYKHFMFYAKLVNDYHLSQNPSENHITRGAFPELSGFLAPEAGPMPMKVYFALMKKINENVTGFSRNVHLLLTCAVKDEFNYVYNVSPYVQCGPSPVNSFLTKSVANGSIEFPDPRYRNTTNVHSPIDLGFWKMFEVEWLKFNKERDKYILGKPNELQAKTESLLAFCQCHPNFTPSADLINSLVTFREALNRQKLLPEHMKKVQEQLNGFRKIIKERIKVSTARTIYCVTEGGAIVPVLIDVCIEHADAEAKKSFLNSLKAALKQGKDIIPQHVSQLVTSNSHRLIPENLMTTLGEHVDIREDYRGIFDLDSSLVDPRIPYEQEEEHEETYFGGTATVLYCPPIKLRPVKSPDYLQLINIHNHLVQQLALFKASVYSEKDKKSFIIETLKYIYQTLASVNQSSTVLQVVAQIDAILTEFEADKVLNKNKFEQLINLLATFKKDIPEDLLMQVFHKILIDIDKKNKYKYEPSPLKDEMALLNPQGFGKETKTQEKQEEKEDDRFELGKANLEMLYELIDGILESKDHQSELLVVLQDDFVRELNTLENSAYDEDEILYLLDQHDKCVHLLEKIPEAQRTALVRDYLGSHLLFKSRMHAALAIALPDNIDQAIQHYQKAIAGLNEAMWNLTEEFEFWKELLGRFKESLAQLFLQKAEQAQEEKNYLSGIEFYSKGIEALENIPPDEMKVDPAKIYTQQVSLLNLYVDACDDLTQLYHANGDIAHLELAANYYKNAIDLNLKIAKYLHSSGEVTELESCEKTGNSLEFSLANCLFTIASHYMDEKSDYQAGIQYCDRIMSIYAGQTDKFTEDKAEPVMMQRKIYCASAYFQYALQLKQNNQLKEAKRFYDKAISIITGIPDKYKPEKERSQIMEHWKLFSKASQNDEILVTSHQTKNVLRGGKKTLG